MTTGVFLRDLSLAQKRRRMSKWLRWLRSAYSSPESAGGRPGLDQLILEFLVDELGPRRAPAALELLQQGFVDWNEVRVTRDVELVRALTAVGLTTGQAARIRSILAALFDRTNALSIDHVRGKPLHEISVLLDGLGTSRRAQSAAALQALGANVLALEPRGLRVLHRLHVVAATTGADEALEELGAVVAAADRADFYLLLAEHARATCRERGPRCPRCVLLKDCPTGRTRTARRKTTKARAAKTKAARRRTTKVQAGR